MSTEGPWTGHGDMCSAWSRGERDPHVPRDLRRVLSTAQQGLAALTKYSMCVLVRNFRAENVVTNAWFGSNRAREPVPPASVSCAGRVFPVGGNKNLVQESFLASGALGKRVRKQLDSTFEFSQGAKVKDGASEPAQSSLCPVALPGTCCHLAAVSSLQHHSLQGNDLSGVLT